MNMTKLLAAAEVDTLDPKRVLGDTYGEHIEAFYIRLKEVEGNRQILILPPCASDRFETYAKEISSDENFDLFDGAKFLGLLHNRYWLYESKELNEYEWIITEKTGQCATRIILKTSLLDG